MKQAQFPDSCQRCGGRVDYYYTENGLHNVACSECGLSWSPEDEPPAAPVDDARRYDHGGIECIDAMRAALTPDEFRGYCKGCVLKYVWGEAYKGGDADLAKAADYLRYATEGGEE